jgi:tRNA modification GTPase
VWNKVDLAASSNPPAGFLPVSAATGAGFPELCKALAGAARALLGQAPGRGPRGAASPAAPRLANGRQKLLLDEALASIDRALAVLLAEEGLDAAALELREAAEALGEITGEITSPEILEAVFSRFCVGK